MFFGYFSHSDEKIRAFWDVLQKKYLLLQDIMQWTDRIRQVKIVLVVSAIVIAGVSLWVSHFLVRDLAIEERNRMGVWAEAMRSLNNADETTDLNLVLKVIDENNTIPVIVEDDGGNIQAFRNIELKGENFADSMEYASALAKELRASERYIRIYLDEQNKANGYLDVCYDESLMLQRLAFYPYVQLGVVLIFVVIAIFALLTSKKAEQNKVWVGLSKETAHQLGTPISSMMAWTEILKESYPDDELIPEMEKDVKRLQRIAERFSKIGSTPELSPTSLYEVVAHVVEYMDRRTSSQVKIESHLPASLVKVSMNASLFEWVIENLCKNAVDAMEGHGRITITAREEGNSVIMDVTDTGKGIARRNLQTVFKPGYTTKKRGWGLGLSLAKRIIEEYHHGKIFVAESQVGVGTTFRIIMKKCYFS